MYVILVYDFGERRELLRGNIEKYAFCWASYSEEKYTDLFRSDSFQGGVTEFYPDVDRKRV